MLEGVNVALDAVEDVIALFLQPPMVYFVGFAIVGAAAGVARKFVPMKRR